MHSSSFWVCIVVQPVVALIKLIHTNYSSCMRFTNEIFITFFKDFALTLGIICKADHLEKLKLLYRLHLPPALPIVCDLESAEVGVEATHFFQNSDESAEGTFVTVCIRIQLSFILGDLISLYLFVKILNCITAENNSKIPHEESRESLDSAQQSFLDVIESVNEITVDNELLITRAVTDHFSVSFALYGIGLSYMKIIYTLCVYQAIDYAMSICYLTNGRGIVWVTLPCTLNKRLLSQYFFL